jgi:hypothetical protein
MKSWDECIAAKLANHSVSIEELRQAHEAKLAKQKTSKIERQRRKSQNSDAMKWVRLGRPPKGIFLFFDSLWERSTPDNKLISEADYSFIKDMYYKLYIKKVVRLTANQMSIFKKIYDRYQSIDFRK